MELLVGGWKSDSHHGKAPKLFCLLFHPSTWAHLRLMSQDLLQARRQQPPCPPNHNSKDLTPAQPSKNMNINTIYEWAGRKWRWGQLCTERFAFSVTRNSLTQVERTEKIHQVSNCWYLVEWKGLACWNRALPRSDGFSLLFSPPSPNYGHDKLN